MPDAKVTRSRALHKRGPSPSPRRRPAPRFGGNSPEEADRHLLNYHAVFADEESYDREFRLTRSIVVAARRWRKVANDRVRPMGQTMARWEAMFLVAFSGQGLTQTELARLISIEGPTMVRMLDQLAQEGLIRRYQSETDARVTTNEITPEGLAAIAAIMKVTNELRSELLSGIDSEKLNACMDVLAQILLKLDELR